MVYIGPAQLVIQQNEIRPEYGCSPDLLMGKTPYFISVFLPRSLMYPWKLHRVSLSPLVLGTEIYMCFRIGVNLMFFGMCVQLQMLFFAFSGLCVFWICVLILQPLPLAYSGVWAPSSCCTFPLFNRKQIRENGRWLCASCPYPQNFYHMHGKTKPFGLALKDPVKLLWCPGLQKRGLSGI